MSDSENPAFEGDTVVLPLPPGSLRDEIELEIYARFMRHLRHAAVPEAELKVLSAIQFTADMLDHSDAFVAKVLVDLGLRASRRAFPQDYIEHVDKSVGTGSGFLRPGRSGGHSVAIKKYWAGVGADECLTRNV